MTDLQHHLKAIRKVFALALDQQWDTQRLHNQLRSVLPAAYGIASGCVVGNGQSSQTLQTVIYDVPLSGGIYSLESAAFQIEHVLLIADVAYEHDAVTFPQLLERLASAKALCGTRKRKGQKTEAKNVAQTRPSIPKDRLPYAFVYFDHFSDFSNNNERLFQRLMDWIGVYPVEQRPDEIDIIGQQIQYLNPLLEHEIVTSDDIGLGVLPNLHKLQACYACKTPYLRRHFFYEKLCKRCGDINYHRRIAKANLSGYIALVTGARVKIGYATALNLLRSGAEVIATSRFPRDTARRFAEESDFDQWHNRLHIYGLDLRQIQQLEPFINRLYERYSHLDILVNNAAQTVKRPAAYYRHLLPLETAPIGELLPKLRDLTEDLNLFITRPIPEYLLPSTEIADADFPTDQFDEHGQQVDNRSFNSWVMPLEEVSIAEMLEVHLVNAVAPGILVGQLKRLMEQSPHAMKFVINVSSAEGRFSQFKNNYHPHTNMAKAALNMLTRTIAAEYANIGIFVNSVDPGWVSDQIPRTDDHSRNLASDMLPIDLSDAAARICTPIFDSINTNNPVYGKFLKDYRAVDW